MIVTFIPAASRRAGARLHCRAVSMPPAGPRLTAAALAGMVNIGRYIDQRNAWRADPPAGDSSGPLQLHTATPHDLASGCPPSKRNRLAGGRGVWRPVATGEG